MQAKHPPRLAERLLDLLLRNDRFEEIMGDLHQHFADMQEEEVRWIRMRYWYHVFQFLRPFALKRPTIQNSNTRIMLKLNLLVAYRSMLRHKLYAFLNILGLGLGLATCILIGIFIKDEMSYDQHWQNGERIYRVSADLKFMDNAMEFIVSPAPMAANFKADFPEIQASGRFSRVGTEVVKVGEKYFNQDEIAFSDQSMMDIFKLNMLRGTHAIEQPGFAIVDESTAVKLFNTIEVVGKSFEIKDQRYEISGVYEDIPANSHFHFHLMMSMANWPDAKSQVWLSNNYITYFLLDETNNYQALQGKFEGVYEKYFGPQLEQFAGVSYGQMLEGGSYVNYYLTPLHDIHLKSNLLYEIEANGNIQYIYILFAASLFVLIIATINFMNISTARSSLRAKEVGMRKVMGSIKTQLINQFMVESVLNAVLALLLAVGFTYLLLPILNGMADKSVTNPFFGELQLWREAVGLTVLVGLLAGIYPAFYLSSFIPVKVLKGQLSLGIRGGKLRNALVVTQFVASVILIFGAMVIYAQLRYTQTKSLGFNKDQVIVIDETHTLGQSIESFREELVAHPAILNSSVSGFLPTGGNRSDFPLLPKAATSSDEAIIGIQQWQVDEYYLETMGLKLLDGRNFSDEYATDSAAVILNQAAVERFGFENPVGERLKTMGEFDLGRTEFQVVGVIEDFHFDHFKNKIGAMALHFQRNTGKVTLRYEANQTSEVLAHIEATWKEFNPDRPIMYEFMDQQFASRYASEEKLGKLFGSFAIFSILIACLGLFGLAAYAIDQRKKEIGVRKVLGASIQQLMLSQLSGYTKLMLFALIIGLPVGHLVMSEWLTNFVYQAEMSLLMYLVPVIAILLLAWGTVSFISYGAASQNPVENLHNE